MDELKGRSFQVWDYSPSLSRLLIRSPRNNEEDHNVDIVFYGVRHMDIVTLLDGISIEIGQSTNQAHKTFLVNYENGVCSIEAVSYSISTSETDIFESPLDTI